MMWTNERREIAIAMHDARRLVTQRGLALALEWGKTRYKGAALKLFEVTAAAESRYLAQIEPAMRSLLRG